MKKNYIAPATLVADIDCADEIMLIGSISMGDKIGDGEAITADGNRRILEEEDEASWGNLW
ncbi:MAG: hypothetical protein KBT29_02755 [Prevotellaceae bacterium]|nr:hypothetical protein [Candidatus Minthosoma caballi]